MNTESLIRENNDGILMIKMTMGMTAPNIIVRQNMMAVILMMTMLILT